MHDQFESTWATPFLLLLVSSTLLQYIEAKRRRSEFPAAISPVISLSGGRLSVRERDGPVNHRAAVHRLGSVLSRSRVCWGGVILLRLCLPGVAGEALAAVAQGNKFSRSCPRSLGGLYSQGWDWGCGDLANPRCRCRRGRLLHRLVWAMVAAALLVMETTTGVGDVACWRVDWAWFSCDVCRHQASIWNRRSLGWIPGRCFSYGVIPALVLGVYCSFLQSFDAMGSLGSGVAMVSSLTTAAGDNGGWWRRLVILGSTGFLDLIVISLFLRGLCARWLRSSSVSVFVRFFLINNTGMFIKKKHTRTVEPRAATSALMAYPDVQIVLTQHVFDGITLMYKLSWHDNSSLPWQAGDENQTKQNSLLICYSWPMAILRGYPFVALSCNLPTSPPFNPHPPPPNAKQLQIRQSLPMADDGSDGFLLPPSISTS